MLEALHQIPSQVIDMQHETSSTLQIGVDRKFWPLHWKLSLIQNFTPSKITSMYSTLMARTAAKIGHNPGALKADHLTPHRQACRTVRQSKPVAS